MTIKSLLVKIGGDTSGLEKAFRSAESTLERGAASLKKAGTVMTGVGAAITGAMVMSIKKTAELGDQVWDLSQKTGISTEVLSGFRLAAEISGTSLEGMATSLRILSKNMVSFGPEADETNAALASLGINTKDAEGKVKALDAVVYEVADRFARMEDGATKSALATKIFGRAGTELIPVLNRGAEGLRSIYDTALRSGQVFSSQAAKGCDDFMDSLTILKSSLQGVAVQIGTALMPAVQRLIVNVQNVVQGVVAWAQSNQVLMKTIVPVTAGVGAALLTLGSLSLGLGALITLLPKVVVGLTALKAAFSVLLGPIGLVIAAVGVGTVVFLQLQDAKRRAAKAAEVAAEANERLKQKLMEAAEAAGMSAAEFEKLNQKYNNNAAAMAMAIKKGREGEALQKSLAEVGRANREEIEKQKKAIEDKISADIRAAAVAEETKKQIETILRLRTELTDEIQRATLSEYEYSRWSIERTYTERQEAIKKEIKDVKARNELLLMAKKAYDSQILELEKKAGEERLREQKRLAEEIWTEEQRLNEERASMMRFYSDERAKYVDAINRLTMSEVEYRVWALEQERQAEIARLEESKALNSMQKEELLAMLEEYYNLKTQMAIAGEGEWLEIMRQALYAAEDVFVSFVGRTLGAFERWGEGGKGILASFAEGFKRMVDDCIAAVKRLTMAVMESAMKTVLAKQAEALAAVIASVMKKVPFPLNLALVGGAIAAVKALFAKIKLAEGGVVTRPTMALIGERGPEAVIPLNKYFISPQPAMAGATMVVNFNSPLIQTTGLTKSQIDEASSYIFSSVENEARRRGYSIERRGV